MTTAVIEQPVRERPVWRPQPRQAVFLPRTEDEVFYGGAAYGGKTQGLLAFSILRREKYPGSAGLFLRRTLQDLEKENQAISESKKMLSGYGHWNDSKHRWLFPNGSILQFGYIDKRDDMYHYQGTAWEDVCWEELTQIPWDDAYHFVNAFCRTDIDGCKPLIRAAANPGGPGHAWVKSRFIDVAPPNTTYVDPLSGRTRVFIPATADDNPIGLARNPGYLRQLEALPGEMARALRFGDWDIVAGQMFSEFRRPIHVATPFAIADNWTRWRGVDYGYASPFSCHWLARSPDGQRVVIYRELYKAELRARDQAQAIRLATGKERIRLTAADPSMWQRRQDTIGQTLADEYASAGVRLTKAINDRVAGWAVMHKGLAWKMLDEQLVQPPRVQIFENCVELIKALGNAPRDQINPEDVHREFKDDHALDSARYALMAEAARHLKRSGAQDLGDLMSRRGA